MILRRKEYFYKGERKDVLKYFLSKKLQQTNFKKLFSHSFSKWLNTDYSILTGSGSEALEIILKFKKLHKSGILFVPVFTAKIVKQTLDYLGVNYVLIDVDPNNGLMDVEDFKLKYNQHPNVSAVLLTHLLGNICNHEIFKFAWEKEIFVIEDCAHAHGAKFNNKMVGSLGDASFFSLGPAKLINTFGGGVLNTNDPELNSFALNYVKELNRPNLFVLLKKMAFSHVETTFSLPVFNLIFRYFFYDEKKLQCIRSFFYRFNREKGKEKIQYSNLQSYLGLKQLQNIDTLLLNRQRIISRIESEIPKHFKRLKKTNGNVPYNFIIRCTQPERLKKHLWSRKIDCGIKNSIMWPLSDNTNFQGLQKCLNTFVQLPLHKDISLKDEKKIIEALLEF